ncbi:MAG TPA: hypothetical protein VHG71_03795 [Verrucomicrobiae bacterium]|nr:hypothetical protein [Verrucomicrobiae bacterium]
MKQIPAILILLLVLTFVSISRADDITAVQSGNWSDVNTWSTQTIPGATDDVDVPYGINVTVDTNATIQFIYDAGTITMGTNSSLELFDDQAIGNETTLDASAVGNTVIYSEQAHTAKATNYYNLVLDGVGTFYNASNVVNVAGDMTVAGTVSVQEANDIAIAGNLTVGSTTNHNNVWDCSSYNLNVAGNTTINGYIADFDGANGANNFNHLTINSGGTLYILDSTNWNVSGNFTNNNGTVSGKGYARVNFTGNGVIVGTPFTIPTLEVDGTYMIGATITLMTNTPTLNGTLVFDLANTNKMILESYPTNALTFYYSGALNVINSGPAPTAGASYTFFSATNFDGAFATENFPALPSGLTWIDNLATSGSIAVSGGSGGSSPIITASQYNTSTHQFTLTWSSTPTALYSVQETPSLSAPITWNTLVSNVPSAGSTTTTNVTMPLGTTGFLRVVQQ